jgi:hypothetical protein
VSLVVIIKKQLPLDPSLHTIFEKALILEGFSNFSEALRNAEPRIQFSISELRRDAIVGSKKEFAVKILCDCLEG